MNMVHLFIHLGLSFLSTVFGSLQYKSLAHLSLNLFLSSIFILFIF